MPKVKPKLCKFRDLIRQGGCVDLRPGPCHSEPETADPQNVETCLLGILDKKMEAISVY